MPLAKHRRKDLRNKQRNSPYRRDAAIRDLTVKMSQLEEQQDRTRAELMELKATEVHASSPAVLGDSDSDSSEDSFGNRNPDKDVGLPLLFVIKETEGETSDHELS